MPFLVPYAIGAILGGIGFAFAGWGERGARLALAVGFGGALAGGALAFALDVPSVDLAAGLPGTKRFAAAAAAGLSALLTGGNLVSLMTSGSGRFNSTRDGAFRGTLVFGILLAVSVVMLRPA